MKKIIWRKKIGPNFQEMTSGHVKKCLNVFWDGLSAVRSKNIKIEISKVGVFFCWETIDIGGFFCWELFIYIYIYTGGGWFPTK